MQNEGSFLFVSRNWTGSDRETLKISLFQKIRCFFFKLPYEMLFIIIMVFFLLNLKFYSLIFNLLKIKFNDLLQFTFYKVILVL